MHRAESDRQERSLRVTPEMRVLRMELASLHPTEAPNLVATPRVMETAWPLASVSCRIRRT
jgi:hypothetical protein